MTIRTHTVQVDWPDNVLKHSEDETAEYIKQALTWYNSHTGYKYFSNCNEPIVINVQLGVSQ